MAGTALVLALAVAPVWVAPVLVSNDGPRDVYNAAVATEIAAGRPPYATYFQLDRGVRPDAAVSSLLELMGPKVGWDVAERLVVTLAMVATLAVLLMLVRGGGPAHVTLLAPLVAWLATNWFVWVGMYDFALSIPCFGALLLILDRPLDLKRHVALQVAFALLYFTHYFTFAVGIGLVASVVGLRALNKQAPARALRVVLPALALLAIETATGGPGAGTVRWPEHRLEEVLGLVSGNFVVSAHRADILAGVIIMLGVGLTVGWRLRVTASAGWRTLSGAEVFGVALILLSLLAPHGVGEGTYIPVRMRLLGAVSLLPAVTEAARRVRVVRLAAAAGVLVVALAVHTGALVSRGRQLDRDRRLIRGLLLEAGAHEGGWVARRFTVPPRDGFLVTAYAYRRLLERVAVQERLVVMDNVEALYGIFPVTWRDRPDWVTFRPTTVGLTVRFIPGAIPWPGGLYVLHERDRKLLVTDPHLEVGRSVASGTLAVTLIRRRD